MVYMPKEPSDCRPIIRAYFKRGVQPKCVVQTGKRGVQNWEMWSPNSQCVFAFGVQCRPLCYVNLFWLPFTAFVCLHSCVQTASKNYFENAK